MAGAFSPGHREVHMNEISDSERLIRLSLAVAECLETLRKHLECVPFSPLVTHALAFLDAEYHDWGKQD